MPRFLSTADMRSVGPAVLPLTTAGHEPGVATGVLVEKPRGMLAEGSRQGHFFGFAFFTADFPGAPLCAAAPLANPSRSRRISEFGVSLTHERPRRPVIGHVLLRGHARNGAADHVESQVLQRFEADATLEIPAVCSAIRYGPMSSNLPLFLYSLVNQVERVG
jgi:hypothetical protein